MLWLRKTAHDVADGIRSAADVLLWGHAYPRTVSLRDLGRLRAQSRTTPAVPAQHGPDLGGPLPGYGSGIDLARLPMQPLPANPTLPQRTPEESVRWSLAYIRSRYAGRREDSH